ncbi:MAG: hypothetical protein GY866_36420 [Proteobacteria bacterium]|nr:hypothetical protein [Pseudomonadota bacterium]
MNDFYQLAPVRQDELFTVVEIEDVPEPRQVDLFAWIDGVPVSELRNNSDELAMHRSIGELMARPFAS